MKNLAELLVTTDTESHIIESDTGYIYDRLIAAVRDDLVGTNLLALRLGSGDIPGSSVDIQVVDRNSLAVHKNVAQGAEIPFGTATVSERTITPLKYGTYPLITEEMLEDGKFSMLELNVGEAGYMMGREIEKLILAAVQEGADANTTPHNATCTGLTIAGICDAVEFLEADGHTGTDLVVLSSEAKDIRQIDTLMEADKSGVAAGPARRMIGQVYGMRVWQSENVNTAGDSLVLDRNHAVVYAEKRPVTVKNYDATTRDCRGIVATMRVEADYLRAAASCTITVS